MDLMKRNTIIKMFIGMVELCIKKEIVRESVDNFKNVSDVVSVKDDEENIVFSFDGVSNIKERIIYCFV